MEDSDPEAFSNDDSDLQSVSEFGEDDLVEDPDVSEPDVSEDEDGGQETDSDDDTVSLIYAVS